MKTRTVLNGRLLTNQPPVLDPVDFGPGSPLLLTDGRLVVVANGIASAPVRLIVR